MNQQLPVEVAEFEQLLRKPNSDPTGFAGFFNSGEFQPTRAQGIQCRRHCYLALEMAGAQRLDFGVPDDFVASVQAFRYQP